MFGRFILCLLLLCCAAFNASAQVAGCSGAAGATLCSRTYHAGATCNGVDQLAWLQGYGMPAGGGTSIKGLDDFPVHIAGVSITVFEGWEQTQYLMSGNSATQDVMLSRAGGLTGGGAQNAPTMFPAGYFFWFPANGTATPDQHIDFHVACNSGNFQALYTLYYTRAPAQ